MVAPRHRPVCHFATNAHKEPQTKKMTSLSGPVLSLLSTDLMRPWAGLLPTPSGANIRNHSRAVRLCNINLAPRRNPEPSNGQFDSSGLDPCYTFSENTVRVADRGRVSAGGGSCSDEVRSVWDEIAPAGHGMTMRREQTGWLVWVVGCSLIK